MRINQKIISYALAVFLVATGIAYVMVAYGEYQDYKELQEIGIKGEAAEKQVEMTFFAIAVAVNFGLFAWVLKSGKTNAFPYIAAIVVSIALIATYVASRTVGVPIIGVEYYIGRLDIMSKILQAIVVAISGFAVYNIIWNQKNI